MEKKINSYANTLVENNPGETWILKRAKIVTDYCELKGWDSDNLSMEQILEIRNLKSWKDAGE